MGKDLPHVVAEPIVLLPFVASRSAGSTARVERSEGVLTICHVFYEHDIF